jgi:hypothetical protein
METELHRRVRQSLNGLLLPVLQDIVIEYIPIVKVGFHSSWLWDYLEDFGPVLRFTGTADRMSPDVVRLYPEWDRKQAQWAAGRQIVTVEPLITTRLAVCGALGDPNNPEFNCILDFRGIVIAQDKSCTIEIDLDLDKILRIIEHDGITPPS